MCYEPSFLRLDPNSVVVNLCLEADITGQTVKSNLQVQCAATAVKRLPYDTRMAFDLQIILHVRASGHMYYMVGLAHAWYHACKKDSSRACNRLHNKHSTASYSISYCLLLTQTWVIWYKCTYRLQFFPSSGAALNIYSHRCRHISSCCV